MRPSDARARSFVARFAVAAFALGVAWPREARATPDFPGVVVKTLGLTAITIDAPQGCTLCHSSNAGGTSLRTFGELMLQDGVMPYDEGSLQAALAKVEQDEPQLIADIKAGHDPNDDATGTSDVHTPEYGCSASRRPSTSGGGGWALAALALAARRRGRRGSARAPGGPE